MAQTSHRIMAMIKIIIKILYISFKISLKKKIKDELFAVGRVLLY